MSAVPSGISPPLARTPLYDLHVALGARMVPFAGYEMPVQYGMGVLKEHLWTRINCGLFDVSHMGQAILIARDGRHETVARALEALVPADVLGLDVGQQRYTQLLARDGGILDDLMVTRTPVDGRLYLVVNAGRKVADYIHLQAHLPSGVTLQQMDAHALLAVQGPAAEREMSRLLPDIATLPFMTGRAFTIGGIEGHISRSGYTGEDGFEISLPSENAVEFASALLVPEGAQPIGLGARDSLRLEAGLCLYGHDIDTTTSPIEARLAWSIQKRRRLEGGFPGADRIQRELRDGPARVRVGLKLQGRAPARESAEIVSVEGRALGVVTSGGYGPSVDGPIAMGYVPPTHAAIGQVVHIMVRGKPLPATVVALPFVRHSYVRKNASIV